MALINCPDCGKQVSDSAISCPNCGYEVKNHIEKMLMELEEAKSINSNNKLIWQYCMDCGEVLHRKKEHKNNKCDFCGGSIIRYPSVTNENINKKTPEELSNWKNDIKAYVQNEKGISPSIPKKVSAQISCPKCGSTQITAVNKKWSLLTGFLTNQTQRFCLNCKHKW